MRYENILKVVVPVSKLLVNGFNKEQIKKYVESQIKDDLKDRLHTVVDEYCDTLIFESVEDIIDDNFESPKFTTEVYVNINLVPVVSKHPIQIEDAFKNGLFKEEK